MDSNATSSPPEQEEPAASFQLKVLQADLETLQEVFPERGARTLVLRQALHSIAKGLQKYNIKAYDRTELSSNQLLFSFDGQSRESFNLSGAARWREIDGFLSDIDTAIMRFFDDEFTRTRSED